jgi:hypothetical protein
MERKHCMRINPGLQLVEKAGLLAKTRQKDRIMPTCPSPEQLLRSRTGHIASAPPVLPLLLPAIAAIISVLL